MKKSTYINIYYWKSSNELLIKLKRFKLEEYSRPWMRFLFFS